MSPFRRPHLVAALAIAHRLMAMEAARERGHAPAEAIAKPVSLEAKPTRYAPAPNRPYRGKRRRQWR